jgi:hypothetical protein
MVVSAAESRGWSWQVRSIDEKDWRAASIEVQRPSGGHFVDALCEISLDSTIQIGVNQTSFYGHGVPELRATIAAGLKQLSWVKPIAPPTPAQPAQPQDALLGMLRRFPAIVRQLRHRHENRASLIVTDEYDVQDLLHALLRGLFYDIRAEDPAPARAGSSSRVDFLVMERRTVVEAKVAGPRLRDKQIGEQLIIDIERYQSHASCDRLVCFVYDPGGYIRNPAGLETDLSTKRGRLSVSVIVVAAAA